VTLPAGREIIHVLPQDFVVDEQDGIGAPIGMTGSRLEVNVHIVNGATSSTQNLIACVNRAGVHVMESTLGQLAAAEAVLTRDEKELGVALVDIGGGTTDIVIYERGAVWHTGVVAVGGDHFTNDIAVGLRTPLPEAEKIKRRCGCALTTMVGEDETMEVASVGGRKPRLMPRRVLSEILQPRAEEIFHLLWDEIRNAGCDRSLNSGLVLTGGGANLEGMAEIAEQIFDLPVRPRLAGRRRRPDGSRQHAGVRHRRRAGDVRAPALRTAAPGRLGERVRARLRPAAGHVPQLPGVTVRERRRDDRENDGGRFMIDDTRRTTNTRPSSGSSRCGSSWTKRGAKARASR
jgi:cell division ATPase FtsA